MYSPKSRKNISKELGPYLNLGWQMAITILLMVLLGWWLDGKFHTSPWLIVICSLFGVVAGMYSFIRTVLNLTKGKE